MSVKKLLILAAASVVAIGATAAMAGGPDVAMPAADTGVYVGVNAGYARVNWRDYQNGGVFMRSAAGVGPFGASNTTGGFTAGATLGYQWNQYLAAELGYQYLPRVRGSALAAVATSTAKSWIGYIAGKISVPVYENTKVFAKLGAAYRRTRVTSGAGVAGSPQAGNVLNPSHSYWAPMFAFGAQYMIDQNWSVNGQYAFYPGYHKTVSLVAAAPTNKINVPDAHVFTVGVDYLFQV